MKRLFPTAVILVVSALLAAAQPAAAARKLLIGSTSASSSHYGYFVAVSQLINDQVAGMESSVVETGATVDNLRRIARGQIDLGLVTTNVLYHAYHGDGDFAGRAVPSKLLWVYGIAPQNVVVRRDAGVAQLAGLAGKRFNPGLKGSATEKTAEAVFGLLGIRPDYVRGSTTDIVAAVKDDRVIGYVKSGAGMKLDGSTRDIMTMIPVTVLSLDADQTAKIGQAMPELSLVDVPAGAGPDLGAYTTWGFAVAASASLDMDEETAYRIVKAVCEDRTVQGNAMASVKGVDLAEMTLKYASTPLHPGAIRYFRERGLQVPERLVGK